MGHPSVYAQLLIHKLLVDSGSLTRLVGELEVVPRCMSSLDLAHRSYAASSVIASATFLEAAVRELFQDAPLARNVAEQGDPASVQVTITRLRRSIWYANPIG